MPDSMGPFETAEDAAAHPAVRAIYDAMRASPVRGVMADLGYRLLEEACQRRGAETGAYDRRIMAWLAGFGPTEAAVFAGLITRGQPYYGGCSYCNDDAETARCWCLRDCWITGCPKGSDPR